jgi:hypothetical protein
MLPDPGETGCGKAKCYGERERESEARLRFEVGDGKT